VSKGGAAHVRHGLGKGRHSRGITLWPTDCRDARDFSDRFYEQIKEEDNSVINLAKVMQKAVLALREDW